MFFTKTKLFEYLCRNEFVIKRSRKIKKKKKRHVQKISPFSDTFLFIYSFTETENKTKENLITIKIFFRKVSRSTIRFQKFIFLLSTRHQKRNPLSRVTKFLLRNGEKKKETSLYRMRNTMEF